MMLLWLLLLFPVFAPFVAKIFFGRTINWTEVLLSIIIVASLTTLVYQAGRMSQASDTEILSGKVLDKKREHGSYIESYSCNCRTVSSGSGKHRTTSTKCDTCHRTHYTVEWFAKTTLGNITFSKLDRTSRSVYNSSDPERFLQCTIDEPVAMEHSYTNYVRAVPESLFHNKPFVQKYNKSIPAYPQVYDFYRVNRVLRVGDAVSAQFAQDLNQQLADELRSLGAKKQVNIIVIITTITDPMYKYAVEQAWVGGKKNDVIVFISLNAAHQILWSDVITFGLNAGNEMLQVSLRDAIKDLQQVDTPSQLSTIITQTVAAKYDRPHMVKYEYLKERIQPPTWVIVLAVIIAFGGSILSLWIFNQIDVDILGQMGNSIRTSIRRRTF